MTLHRAGSSGAVISGVADRVPERISQLVYLDAFVPEDGQAVFDLIPPQRRPAMETLVETEASGGRYPGSRPSLGNKPARARGYAAQTRRKLRRFWP
jgi:hypothetical protein